jgi:catechol 2,3-dioxygenase-like lactoylglutathione lyase family enzyme
MMRESDDIRREKQIGGRSRDCREVESSMQSHASTQTSNEVSIWSIKGFPIGWLILWLLLAASLVVPPASRGQQLDASPGNTTSRVAASASSTLAIEEVASIGMTVSDMDRAIDFYSRVLSFQKVTDVEVVGEDYEHLQGVFGLRMRVVRMRLGDEFLELTEYLAPKGRPIPVDSRSNDHWFQHIAVITSDMDRAYGWLRRNKVEHASTGPQRLPDWNKSAGGIKAFYFRDPDRHWIEILQFPHGKGDSKWQQSNGKLFLGIDHTAIVVGNTDASLRLYRDTLGMRVAGESENFGTEQEHLNNVSGARLRITSMRAGRGPGIEFLEYLAPLDGRKIPGDIRANDLSYWQTRLAVRSANKAAEALSRIQSAFISAGVVELRETTLGFRRGLVVRDPDGHAMQLVEN